MLSRQTLHNINLYIKPNSFMAIAGNIIGNQKSMMEFQV
jgi:hypothetical protein